MGLPWGSRAHLDAFSLSTGMCLQAFVEAFFFLAQRKFKMLPLHEQVASLIDLCEYHLSLLDEKRLVCRQSGIVGGRSLHSIPHQDACSPSQANGAEKFSHPRPTLS